MNILIVVDYTMNPLRWFLLPLLKDILPQKSPKHRSA